MGQFPFLDIALEWDGDKTLQRKRGHVVGDLLSLVAAIGTAMEADRLLMQPALDPTPIEELPDHIRPLFAKPVVAIHPGAGNLTKQWPEEHFSALIDLLIDRNGVNVLLIGGPDEVEIAESLIASVLNPGAVASMVGQTSLTALPRLLAACTLYVGNDSGPKHIAAAVGVPTIGIHSGVVDAMEWGPLGPRTVALRRDMTCSPCYLADAADCPRGLACLTLLEPTHVHRAAETMLARVTLPVPAALSATRDIPEETDVPKPKEIAAVPAPGAAKKIAAARTRGGTRKSRRGVRA
jgi:ADP-heptose:LPS heptosyltransferase